jgi:large subunit ribosomal protein L27
VAHTKAVSSTHNLRDSNAQYLGVKVGHGQRVRAGAILVRQRGAHYEKGSGVKHGKDDTLYAAQGGIVQFYRRRVKNFAGKGKEKVFVRVLTEGPTPVSQQPKPAAHIAKPVYHATAKRESAPKPAAHKTAPRKTAHPKTSAKK